MLAGCGIGQGDSAGATPLAAGVSPGTGLVDAGSASQAPWLVLDLDSGQVSGQQALPDLASNPAYRDRLLVLRRIPAQAAALGQVGSAFARQDGELPGSRLVAAGAVAAFELTRAQWRRLAGTAPWTADALAGTWAQRDDLPATAMSVGEARVALALWSGRHGRLLQLPDDDLWECAARGGGAGAFPWGEARDGGAAAWALTADGAPPTPQPVGLLIANPLGLHDVVGNVWEMTAGGFARGGSWADALALGRPANRLAIDPALGHANVGLRVALAP
jgi:formylglycine-generating enzyme required for sulfatase activity